MSVAAGGHAAEWDELRRVRQHGRQPVAQTPAADELLAEVDQGTRDLLARRRSAAGVHRRGWVVRRALFVADVIGLVAAFALAESVFGPQPLAGNNLTRLDELAIFALTIPLWIVLIKLHGLYDRDEEHTDHSTVDEAVRVLHVITLGTWGVFVIGSLTSLIQPETSKLLLFWLSAPILVAALRTLARTITRRQVAYLQNTLIIGAGDVGQLVARKFLQHPEYGINVVGLVDAEPKQLRPELEHIAVIGAHWDLREIVRTLDVERVVVAFSGEPAQETLEVIRSVRDLDIQIDVVPRLFDLLGPRVAMHSVEGLTLIGLPPVRTSRSSALIKRVTDIVLAALMLILVSPLFAYIAVRVRRSSPGPIFFRQARLGQGMKEFTALKFRSMRVDTDQNEHRAFIGQVMSAGAQPTENGLYKLSQASAVTPFGRWLRRTSLDELPQLLNVLRGDMSLVGPRPCIAYETEHFAPHHFERFLVPAGLTGLWQVTARAHSTFGEALDMDVAYVRSWSLGLDLRLFCRTPFQLLRQGGTT